MNTRVRTGTWGRLSIGLVALAIGGAAPARAQPVQPQFQVVQSGFGDGPEAVASGDFNNDGKLDIAVTNADGNTISIWIQQSSGGFTTNPTRTLTGTSQNPLKSPQGIAVADFNNNGKLDIAVSNYNGSSVSIFLGNGDGTFGAPTNVAVPANPLGVATGKFHSVLSANVDIAVTTKTTKSVGSVTVLLGDGSGAFPSQVSVTGFDHPRRLVVGDFGTDGGDGVSTGNGSLDGNVDIAATTQGAQDAVMVAYGNGDATFKATLRKHPAGTGPNGIVQADFNLDTCMDVATANDSGSISKAYVLYGKCSGNSGSFADGASSGSLTFAANANTFSLITADLNNDGKPDLAVTNTGSSGISADTVVALLNTCVPNPTACDFNPSFANQPTCAAGDAPKGIAAGNFNTDSNVDLAVANRNSDNVSVLFGNGSWSSCPSPTQLGVVRAAKNPVAMALCDVTNSAGTGAPDSAPDIVVLDQGPPEQLVVFSNDALGNFTKTSTKDISSLGSKGSAIACGDRNGDGKSDVAVTNDPNGTSNDNAVICLNNSTGGFNCSTLVSNVLAGPSAIVLTDLNGGGGAEYCITNADGNTVLCESDGSHAIGVKPFGIAAGLFRTSATLKDLAIAPQGSGLHEVDLLFNNDGGIPGNFVDPYTIRDISDPNRAYGIATADMDGDGLDDILTANKGQGTVSLLHSRGDGGFDLNNASGGSAPNSVAAADFNCDNLKDAAVADAGRDKVSVLTGNGTTLNGCAKGAAGCEFDGGDGAVSIVAGNLNLNDTRGDIAVLDSNSGTLTVLLNCTPTCGCDCPPCPVCP